MMRRRATRNDRRRRGASRRPEKVSPSRIGWARCWIVRHRFSIRVNSILQRRLTICGYARSARSGKSRRVEKKLMNATGLRNELRANSDPPRDVSTVHPPRRGDSNDKTAALRSRATLDRGGTHARAEVVRNLDAPAPSARHTSTGAPKIAPHYSVAPIALDTCLLPVRALDSQVGRFG